MDSIHRYILAERVELSLLEEMVFSDSEVSRLKLEVDEHIENGSIACTVDILLLLLQRRLDPIKHFVFILSTVQTSFESSIPLLDGNEVTSHLSSMTASCLIMEYLHEQGALDSKLGGDDISSSLTSIATSLFILFSNLSPHLALHMGADRWLRFTSHENMVLSRQAIATHALSPHSPRVPLRADFNSTPCFLNTPWGQRLAPLVDTSMKLCWRYLRSGASDESTVGTLLERMCRRFRSVFKKDTFTTVPQHYLPLLHAMLVLLLRNVNIFEDSSVLFTLSDTSFIALYRTCGDLIESPHESLQTYGLVTLLNLVDIASPALILSVTPDIHVFLLNTLKCVSQQQILEILTVRIFSVVIVCTSATKSSVKFSNQMLQSIHSLVKLHKKHSLALPLVIGLNPFLQLIDSVVLAYNADIIAETYLSCLNMWSLPIQKEVLTGLSTFVSRTPMEYLGRLIIIITGELIRVFEFYSAGYKDISNASSTEVQDLLSHVIKVGRLLNSLNPEYLRKLFAAVQGDSKAIDEMLLEILSDEFEACMPHTLSSASNTSSCLDICLA